MTNDTRLEDAPVDEIVRRIVRAMDPEKVILFGSRGRDDARRGSDFDLMVIKQSNQPRYRRSAPLYTVLADLPVEVDLVVYTPEEVQQWEPVKEAFATTAIREGKVVYEREGGRSAGLAEEGGQ